jgi:hypothetical protein
MDKDSEEGFIEESDDTEASDDMSQESASNLHKYAQNVLWYSTLTIIFYL